MAIEKHKSDFASFDYTGLFLHTTKNKHVSVGLSVTIYSLKPFSIQVKEQETGPLRTV